MTPNPSGKSPIVVRTTRPEDFDGIIDLCRRVYPSVHPYTPAMLGSQHGLFPDGQFVAVEEATGRVVGMCASLIVNWDDYGISDNWRDFTDHGMFTNHDPQNGKTLYAAEVMVDPGMQGRGIGKMLYKARRELCRRLGLRRIRAGARLRGYEHHADKMSAQEYVKKVIAGEIGDPTLSFQIKQGFRVIGVVESYLSSDPASRGAAAVIEWVNHQVAQRADYAKRPPEFGKPRKRAEPADAADR